MKFEKRVKTRLPEQRIGCFDIETRSLGFHNGGPFKPIGCAPIAVSWRIFGEDQGYDRVAVSWRPEDGELRLVSFFDHFLAKCNVVMGHNILKFDLPILNRTRLELGMRPLPKLKVIDTLHHLKKMGGGSRSMENLAAVMGIADQKPPVPDHKWRAAGRGDPAVLEDIRRRCHDDVKINIQLYERLKQRGWLHDEPKVWTS